MIRIDPPKKQPGSKKARKAVAKQTKVLIEIESCAECLDHETTPVRTADSFERPDCWKCKKAGRVVAACWEWTDPTPAIPTWCPRRPKK